jgi:hypothetical protein
VSNPGIARAAALVLLAGGCGGRYGPTAPAPTPTPAVASPARVLRMTWDTLGIPTAEGCPLAGELASVSCTVRDDEGDAYTITLRLENFGPGRLSASYPTTVTRSVPAAASVSDNQLHALFALEGSTAHVEAVCETVDSHGLRDVRRGGCT